MASNILLKLIIHFNVAAAWQREAAAPLLSVCVWTLKSYLCAPADSQQSALYGGQRVGTLPSHLQSEQRREDFIPGKVQMIWMVSRNNNNVDTRSWFAPFLVSQWMFSKNLHPKNSPIIPIVLCSPERFRLSCKKPTSWPLIPRKPAYLRKKNIAGKILGGDLTFILHITPFVQKKNIMHFLPVLCEVYSCFMKVWYLQHVWLR